MASMVIFLEFMKNHKKYKRQQKHVRHGRGDVSRSHASEHQSFHQTKTNGLVMALEELFSFSFQKDYKKIIKKTARLEH